MPARMIIGVLAAVLMLLQYRLWASDDGYREVFRLNGLIHAQSSENTRLAQRNQRLEAEVHELRRGDAAIEERARADLGLVGERETFYIFGEPVPPG